MLSGNITANLDNLATIGVLDYDAASYIAGARPRFYGAPNANTSPFVDGPMDFTTFSYNQNKQQSSPWYKTAFKWAVVLGATYLGGKFLLKTGKGVKSLSPKNWFSSAKAAVTGATASSAKTKVSWFNNVKNSISNFWATLINNRYVKVPGRKFKF